MSARPCTRPPPTDIAPPYTSVGLSLGCLDREDCSIMVVVMALRLSTRFVEIYSGDARYTPSTEGLHNEAVVGVAE